MIERGGERGRDAIGLVACACACVLAHWRASLLALVFLSRCMGSGMGRGLVVSGCVLALCLCACIVLACAVRRGDREARICMHAEWQVGIERQV